MHDLLHLAEHALVHSLWETLKLLPFLYLTYLLMELLEHKAGDKIKGVLRKSGRFGPLLVSVDSLRALLPYGK